MNGISPPRILIVDDEGDLVTALCRILDAQGFSAVGAGSAMQALEQLRAATVGDAAQFDVLITDLMMPVMDGIALLRAAHEIDGNLVSIVMTGHGTIDTAVAAMKAGALDYILKPINLRTAMPVLVRGLAVRKLRVENSALLRQVACHTAELEAANCVLRSVNKELDAFAHSVAHDVRQPLNVIIGFAELLLSEKPGALNAKQKDFLGDVYQGGQQLLNLTDALLRFARLSQQSVIKQVVNMEALVWEILRTMQPAAAAREVDLRVGPLPDALADPALLRQVLVNVLSNAFKFTQHVSHPLIEVTGVAGSGAVTYQISDNGAGFDMADAPRLFGIFQRLHSKTEFEGNGVGLSMVKRILERHGGTVSAYGEIGLGARFKFTLPAKSA